MYRRLTDTFRKLDVNYEIIFVNDGSPTIARTAFWRFRRIQPHVVGITHSRNFGSQMAFRSGMEMSVMQACVLLDGDLQDPPELIEQFYQRWIEGYDVVYGRRVKRDMPFVWRYFVQGFLSHLREVELCRKFPLTPAGDFSLIDRRVVGWLLRCPSEICFSADCGLTSASARPASIMSGRSACSERARTTS